MVHNQLRVVIAIASLYLLSLVALSVRDLQGVDVQNLWSASDWLEFLGLCGLYVVTGLLGLMTAQTLSLRVTRWFGTAWWCCTALSAASTVGFVALLFRRDQDAAAKELYESVHQYELKFSGVGEASAAARPTIGSSSIASIASPSSAVVSSRPHSRPSGSGIRGRGYNACHDGILYGDRNQWATLNADSPSEGWFLAFVTEAILDSVVQVVFMTLVCLATARLQAYLEDWVEATYSQDDHLQEEGQSPSEVKVDVPLTDKENTATVDDEKKRQALIDAGYLDLAEKKTDQ